LHFPGADVLVLEIGSAHEHALTPQKKTWTWRMLPTHFSGGQAHGLAQLAEMTDRDGWVEPEKT